MPELSNRQWHSCGKLWRLCDIVLVLSQKMTGLDGPGKTQENPAWLGQRSDGFHHQRVGFFREFESKFSMNGWCWFRNGHRSASQNGFKREKSIRRWDTTTCHSPNRVSERAFLLHAIYFSMLKKWGVSSPFFLVLRSFTQCRAGVSIAILYSGFSRLPNKMSPRSPRRTPTPYEEMISGGILRREPLNEVAIYWGPPKKWECSKLGKIKIRKEGQTVKKRWQQKKVGVFFLFNFFPRKADSDISASSKVALNWSLCKNLVHNPLVPEFVSTVIMRTGIKWTLFLSDSFSYEDVLLLISGAII